MKIEEMMRLAHATATQIRAEYDVQCTSTAN